MNRLGPNITPLSQAGDVLGMECHHVLKVLQVQKLSGASCIGISLYDRTFFMLFFPILGGCLVLGGKQNFLEEIEQ